MACKYCFVQAREDDSPPAMELDTAAEAIEVLTPEAPRQTGFFGRGGRPRAVGLEHVACPSSEPNCHRTARKGRFERF